MLETYRTRDDITGSRHRGQELKPNKLVRMSEVQAKAHNKGSEEGKPKLVKAKASDKPEDYQFASDYQAIQEAKTDKKKK